MTYYAIAQRDGAFVKKGQKVRIISFGKTTKTSGRSFYAKYYKDIESYCLERNCAHLRGGSWKIIKEDASRDFKIILLAVFFLNLLLFLF